MLQPYIESANSLIIILMMKKRKNFPFLSVGRNGPRNVCVDLKYDVLCLWVFVYGIPA